MAYNILNMLDLAQIPIRSAKRQEGDRLCWQGRAYNPEPQLRSWTWYSGEGEEVLGEHRRI